MFKPRVGTTIAVVAVLFAAVLPNCSSNSTTDSDAGIDDASAPDAAPDGKGTVVATSDGAAADATMAVGHDSGGPDVGNGDAALESCDGGPTCTTSSSCPAQTTSCLANACVSGCCSVTNEAAGTSCTDHSGSVCDGKGACVACNQASDCTASTTACKTDTCTANTCGASNAASGTACSDSGGQVCDGSGHCVACDAPTDCPAQLTLCKSNTCAANACGTSNATSGTACTDNGGRVCGGTGACVACNQPTDCPAPTTACVTNTCTGSACGTANTALGTSCNELGGVVCDGRGACVPAHCTDTVKDADETDVDCGGSSCSPCADAKACLVGADCVDKVCTGHVCQAPTCTDGVRNGAETDTDCGGTTCDGLGKTCADQKHCGANADCVNSECFGSSPGTCVSCTDSAKDGTETDVDCGGAACDQLGKKCAVAKGCSVNGDCTSNECTGGVCALFANGQSCTSAGQCSSGNCVGPAGNQVCCNSQCSGSCQACTLVLTGQANGTCATQLAGTPASVGQCAANAPCGNDGKCAAGGACEQTASGAACGSPSCSGSTLTLAGTCSGTGSCQGGTSEPCPGDLTCASATACKAACTANTDCAGGEVCMNPGPSGRCLATLPGGAICITNNQCTSGDCGVAGSGTRCCTAACGAVGGTCGATDCDGTGACVFPTSGTACGGPASCSSGILTPASTCSGTGSCQSGVPAPCAGNFICASATACKTACASNADCIGGDVCQNPGASGTCVSTLPPGTACFANNQCTSGECGTSGIGHCCTAGCIPGPCGASDCDALGACVYVAPGTACGPTTCAGSFLELAPICSGGGFCFPSFPLPLPCPGGFACANATTCKTSCIVNADCAAGLSCDAGSCVALAPVGTSCIGNNQCQSGVCGTSGVGHCCTSVCSPSGGACGATDCDGAGSCSFPGSTTAPAGFQTPGDCQKIVCNGSGGVMSVDDATDLPTSSTECLINPGCSGPSPLTPVFTDSATGTSCVGDNNPPQQCVR